MLRTAIIAMGLLTSSNCIAQECAEIEEELKGFQAEYKPQFDAIEADGKKLEEGAPDSAGAVIGVDYDLTWGEQRWIFDSPEVTMKPQRMIFGAPQVAMKRKKMAVDVPTIRMVPRKVGEYPEMECKRPWSCTVKWHDVITHVPETYMVRTEWDMDIPETRWENTELQMDLPEVSMRQQSWAVNLPQITLKNAKAETKKIEDEGADLKSRGESLAAEIREKAANTTGRLVACHAASIQAQRTQVAAMFDGALMQANAAIETAKLQKADPVHLIGADGSVINLIAQRDEILRNREAALKTFDDAAEAMQNGLTESVEGSIDT